VCAAKLICAVHSRPNEEKNANEEAHHHTGRASDNRNDRLRNRFHVPFDHLRGTGIERQLRPSPFHSERETQLSTAVAIPIPASAFHVASNSDATKVVYTRYNTTGYDIFLMGKDWRRKTVDHGT